MALGTPRARRTAHLARKSGTNHAGQTAEGPLTIRVARIAHAEAFHASPVGKLHAQATVATIHCIAHEGLPSTSALRGSPCHPKGRNEVEEPRSGLTRRAPQRSRRPPPLPPSRGGPHAAVDLAACLGAAQTVDLTTWILTRPLVGVKKLLGFTSLTAMSMIVPMADCAGRALAGLMAPCAHGAKILRDHHGPW